VDFSLFTHGLLIRKDFKQQGWISPEIGGLVLTLCSDSANSNAFPGPFYL
jgi:hypothetical protein